jgi:hypothetical protein
VFGRILAGKKPQWPGRLDQPHTARPCTRLCAFTMRPASMPRRADDARSVLRHFGCIMSYIPVICFGFIGGGARRVRRRLLLPYARSGSATLWWARVRPRGVRRRGSSQRNSRARWTKSSWNWNTPPCPASG